MDVLTLRGGPVGARGALDVGTTTATARAQTFESLTAQLILREGPTCFRGGHQCDFRPGPRRAAAGSRPGTPHGRADAQCAASRQVRPIPTPTSRGTDSS